MVLLLTTGWHPLRGDFGITISQEFASNVVKNCTTRTAAVKSLKDTTDQISRSFLWRSDMARH
jgi:hypothetical protein